MSTQLSCPNCQAFVLAENINIESLVAKCGNCNHVFSFEKEVPQPAYQKPEVYLPPGIEAFSLMSELNLEIDWRQSRSSFLTFFTILWNALLLPFVAVAISTGEYETFLFISLHLLVGVSLIYYTLTVFLNTTYVTVDHYNLHIEHRPLRLPFYPDRHIPVTDLSQLHVEKYVSSKTNNRPNYAYAVTATFDNDEQIRIIKGLKKMDQARYVEQEVERFLKIEDAPMAGEYVRGSM